MCKEKKVGPDGEPIDEESEDEDEQTSPEIDEATKLRANLLGRCIFLFITQGALAILVGYEIMFDDTTAWYQYADSVMLVFARFMCGIVLHMQLSSELQQGMLMMKYSVNHEWKFQDYKVAFLCGFLQAFNTITVEMVNFVALLTNFTIIDVIMNFLALVVIAEFDEYFYDAVSDDNLTDICQGADPYGEFLMIQRTTSSKAKWKLTMDGKKAINQLRPQPCEEEFMKETDALEKELAQLRKERDAEMDRINVLADATNSGGITSLVQTSLSSQVSPRDDEYVAADAEQQADGSEAPGCCTKFWSWITCSSKAEDETKEEEEKPVIVGLPTHIRADWSSRTCSNKFLYFVYKVFRFFFVTIWFYFVPFFAMICSYIVPWFFRQYYPMSDEEWAAATAGGDD